MCGNWKVRNCELRTANCAVDVMMDVNEEGTRDIGVGNVHSGGKSGCPGTLGKYLER